MLSYHAEKGLRALLLHSCPLALCSRSPQALVCGRAPAVSVRGGSVSHSTHTQTRVPTFSLAGFKELWTWKVHRPSPGSCTAKILCMWRGSWEEPLPRGESGGCCCCIETVRSRVPQPGFKQSSCTTEPWGPSNLFLRCLCLRYPSLSPACLSGCKYRNISPEAFFLQTCPSHLSIICAIPPAAPIHGMTFFSPFPCFSLHPIPSPPIPAPFPSLSCPAQGAWGQSALPDDQMSL